jgi:hypothetical protein
MSRHIKDLTGQRFGKLIANHQSGRTKTKQIIWNCVCDCGKEIEVRSTDLSSGHTKSCGCYNIEKISERSLKNLIGKRFGKLVINYQSGRTEKKQVIWNCICDCGNMINIKSTYLLNGDTKSCGCLSESLIAHELKKYFVENNNAKIEYKILKNPDTGCWLPYDIYIPNGKNLLVNGVYIEINGEQHYTLNKWHERQAINKKTSSAIEFEYQKEKDKLKKKFAKKNGIYIEIDLSKIKTIKEAIIFIEENL